MPPRRLWLVVAIFVFGCGTTSDSQDPPSQPSERSDPPTPSPSKHEVEPTPQPQPEPEPAPYVPDPQGFGDACSDDAGCGWDDPCAPSRCVGAAHVPADLKCGEAWPPPGTCSCVEGRCSLRPDKPPANSPSCRLESCGLDQGAGRCVAGQQLEANRYTRDVGPACHCEQDSLECRFVWVEPIACEDVDACWVSDNRPYHPIARPKSLRGRKFRPCRDGEVAPVCKAGFCSVAAYSC